MSPVEEHLWFNAEVKPCEPALRAYLLRRFPVLSDHDDLMQEAYTKVLYAKRKGRLTSVKAFLFTVTRNLAVDMVRRHKRSLCEPLPDEDEPTRMETIEDVGVTVEHRQRLEILLQAVESLPTRCREVLILRHLDGLSYKEIGVRLGISPNTVRVHIVKGMRNCLDYFREHGLIENQSEQTDAAGGEATAG